MRGFGAAAVLVAVTLLSPLGAPAVTTGFPRTGTLAFSCAGCPSDAVYADVYTIRPDGSHLRLLPGTKQEYEPRWSPDGRTLSVSYAFRQIRVRRAADGSARRLTRPIRGEADTSAVWSPDGRHLVFVRLAPPPPGRGMSRSALWTIRADGTRPRELLQAPRNVTSPDWAPDGRRIAYSDVVERLWVVRADGSHPRRLGPALLQGRDPRWSPDGARVAFADADAGVDRILDVRTGRVRTLVGLRAFDGYAWSPDGRWLALLSTAVVSCDDPTGECQRLELWIVSASGDARRRVWSAPYGEVYGLDWKS